MDGPGGDLDVRRVLIDVMKVMLTIYQPERIRGDRSIANTGMAPVKGGVLGLRRPLRGTRVTLDSQSDLAVVP